MTPSVTLHPSPGVELRLLGEIYCNYFGGGVDGHARVSTMQNVGFLGGSSEGRGYSWRDKSRGLAASIVLRGMPLVESRYQARPVESFFGLAGASVRARCVLTRTPTIAKNSNDNQIQSSHVDPLSKKPGCNPAYASVLNAACIRREYITRSAPWSFVQPESFCRNT